MRVVIVHNAVDADASPDDRDVLVQVDVVRQALERLGYEATVLPCDLDLAAARDQLVQVGPDVVFNLVESLGGAGRLAPAAAALVEHLGLPYTGASADALFLTGQKLLAKQHMRAAGLPTPDWVVRDTKVGAEGLTPDPGRRYIIKSVWEDASFGLEDSSVVDGTDVLRGLEERSAHHGAPWFGETYIEGREFNVALLAGQSTPTVLPVAEIEFVGFGVHQPRIVGYRAKWHATSFEYTHTPRRFDFAEEERPLLATLSALALRVWDVCGLQGYARVDFRVDAAGQPWILEANANPCLSPDAGYAAALARAGVTFESAVARLIEAACAGRSAPQGAGPPAFHT